MENLRVGLAEALKTQIDNENSELVKRAARLIPSRAALQEEPSVIECRFPRTFVQSWPPYFTALFRHVRNNLNQSDDTSLKWGCYEKMHSGMQASGLPY